jgi:phosphoribosylformylglycinamidine cyclo-ligase
MGISNFDKPIFSRNNSLYLDISNNGLTSIGNGNSGGNGNNDNMIPIPPLFTIIQESSGTDWDEMYQVFNMGHRMEVYTDESTAKEVIAIAKSFNVDAQIIGRVLPMAHDGVRWELITEKAHLKA